MQGVGHKAAVGEHRAEAQSLLPLEIAIAQKKRDSGNIEKVDRHGEDKCRAEIVEIFAVKGPLECHDQHTGGHHIYDQIGHAHRGFFTQQLRLAQHKACADYDKQDQHLFAYHQKRSDHRGILLIRR